MSIESLINCDDAERAAERYLPKAVFDFIAGGVDDERGMARNRERLAAYGIVPKYLVEKRPVDTSVTLFGTRYSTPIGIAPMGYGGLFRPGADVILAETAAEVGMPYVLSMASSSTLERIGRIPGLNGWFQIYPCADQTMFEDLIRRAQDAGMKALVLTIDAPCNPKRERNLRSGLWPRPKIGLSTVLDGLMHPAWTFRHLKAGGSPSFENWRPYVAGKPVEKRLVELVRSTFPFPATMHDIEVCRRVWKGPLLVKGVLHADDAEKIIELGANGIIVSNHGGRQFDPAPSAIDALRALAPVVKGRATLLMDGGVRRGSDVIVARSLGAAAVLCGRPFMFATAALGKAGARKLADLLTAEVRVALAQSGSASLDDVEPRSVIEHDNAPNTNSHHHETERNFHDLTGPTSRAAGQI